MDNGYGDIWIYGGGRGRGGNIPPLHGREASTLKDVTPLLIINDVPRAYIPTKHLFMQTYSFNWTARASPVP